MVAHAYRMAGSVPMAVVLGTRDWNVDNVQREGAYVFVAVHSNFFTQAGQWLHVVAGVMDGALELGPKRPACSVQVHGPFKAVH